MLPIGSTEQETSNTCWTGVERTTILLPFGIMNHPSHATLHQLARFVRERRVANGLTQTELALLAGVGRRFVSELESAKSTLRVGKVSAVLSVFGKDLGLVDATRTHDDSPKVTHELPRQRTRVRKRRHG